MKLSEVFAARRLEPSGNFKLSLVSVRLAVKTSESRMMKIGTSCSMSGDGKRGVAE